ncbi:MAG: hypothetical protein ACJAUL_000078 [Paraglaciecola sp.]|jgi:hypothetical protein
MCRVSQTLAATTMDYSPGCYSLLLVFTISYRNRVWDGSAALANTSMNILKNLALAVIIAILLTYSLGYVATDWFGVNVQMNSESIAPLTSLLVFIVLGIMLVLVGFVVALSVFGALAFVALAIAGALLFAGLSAFWPAILVVLLVIWLLKDKRPSSYQ